MVLLSTEYYGKTKRGAIKSLRDTKRMHIRIIHRVVPSRSCGCVKVVGLAFGKWLF
jgi:hypothetical protein